MRRTISILGFLLVVTAPFLDAGSLRVGFFIAGSVLVGLVFLTSRRDVTWWGTAACIVLAVIGFVLLDRAASLSPHARIITLYSTFGLILVSVLLIVVPVVRTAASALSAVRSVRREIKLFK